jgi:hypothetical protein
LPSNKGGNVAVLKGEHRDAGVLHRYTLPRLDSFFVKLKGIGRRVL